MWDLFAVEHLNGADRRQNISQTARMIDENHHDTQAVDSAKTELNLRGLQYFDSFQLILFGSRIANGHDRHWIDVKDTPPCVELLDYVIRLFPLISRRHAHNPSRSFALGRPLVNDLPFQNGFLVGLQPWLYLSPRLFSPRRGGYRDIYVSVQFDRLCSWPLSWNEGAPHQPWRADS